MIIAVDAAGVVAFIQFEADVFILGSPLVGMGDVLAAFVIKEETNISGEACE